MGAAAATVPTVCLDRPRQFQSLKTLPSIQAHTSGVDGTKIHPSGGEQPWGSLPPYESSIFASAIRRSTQQRRTIPTTRRSKHASRHRI